ncbi:hypothetical protein KKF04_01100 [Patescibacteria group bacterium]|nr:hypothetical protein [Patescibacteria group bacterium]MBU1934630.1 hypothetical protein [Patescibacteria group bacterium]
MPKIPPQLGDNPADRPGKAPIDKAVNTAETARGQVGRTLANDEQPEYNIAMGKKTVGEGEHIHFNVVVAKTRLVIGDNAEVEIDYIDEGAEIILGNNSAVTINRTSDGCAWHFIRIHGSGRFIRGEKAPQSHFKVELEEPAPPPIPSPQDLLHIPVEKSGAVRAEGGIDLSLPLYLALKYRTGELPMPDRWADKPAVMLTSVDDDAEAEEPEKPNIPSAPAVDQNPIIIGDDGSFTVNVSLREEADVIMILDARRKERAVKIVDTTMGGTEFAITVNNADPGLYDFVAIKDGISTIPTSVRAERQVTDNATPEEGDEDGGRGSLEERTFLDTGELEDLVHTAQTREELLNFINTGREFQPARDLITCINDLETAQGIESINRLGLSGVSIDAIRTAVEGEFGFIPASVEDIVGWMQDRDEENPLNALVAVGNVLRALAPAVSMDGEPEEPDYDLPDEIMNMDISAACTAALTAAGLDLDEEESIDPSELSDEETGSESADASVDESVDVEISLSGASEDDDKKKKR